MPKARQSGAIGSPSRSCATNRRRSSITEHSFHGIHTSRFWEKAEGVTHVSGTNCHPCLGPLMPTKALHLLGCSAHIVHRDAADPARGRAHVAGLLRELHEPAHVGLTHGK